MPVPTTVQVSVPYQILFQYRLQIPPEIEEVEPVVSDKVEIIEIAPQLSQAVTDEGLQIATSVFELEGKC